MPVCISFDTTFKVSLFTNFASTNVSEVFFNSLLLRKAVSSRISRSLKTSKVNDEFCEVNENNHSDLQGNKKSNYLASVTNYHIYE